MDRTVNSRETIPFVVLFNVNKADDSPKQMNFVHLPPELLTLCLSYLDGYDLCKVSQTCRLLNELADNDLLWQSRCENEYRLKSTVGWQGSYKEIYGLVLHRFGFLIGLWRNSTTFYGGLVNISFKEDGRIVAEELYALGDVREKLRAKELFQITLTENKTIQMHWLGSFWGPHECTITPCAIGGQGPSTINVEWKEQEDMEKLPENIEETFPTIYTRHDCMTLKRDIPNSRIHEKLRFLEESRTRGTHPDLCMYKWLSHRKHQFAQNFTRLVLPSPVDRLPVTLGLYKGLYGGHGTEIVLLTYDETNNKLNARKISGDPNVPAGEISLCVDLSRPMILTREQQETLGRLKNLDHNDTVPDPGKESLEQPFNMPPEIDVENGFEVPHRCKARYHSLGTVSPMEYRNPTKIDNHFIVFDKDTFGILWIALYSFSFFSRVQEDVTKS